MSVIEQREGKTPPHHRAGGEDLLCLGAEPLESPPDHEPYALGHVELIDGDVDAELPGVVEDLAFLDEMPEDLLDEERVALRLLEDGADDRVGRGLAREGFEHHRDAGAVEALHRQALHGAGAHEPFECRRERARDFELDIAVGADAQHSKFRHECSHVFEQEQCRFVGPVDVVDYEHQREPL